MKSHGKYLALYSLYQLLTTYHGVPVLFEDCLNRLVVVFFQGGHEGII